jgi:hypothetical protein
LDEKLIYTIAIFAFILISVVGYAGVVPFSGIVPIGGDDDPLPQITDLELHKVEWILNGGVFDEVGITAKNTDSVSHTFELCAIYPDGASISDTAGTTPDCVNQAYNSGQIRTTTISISNPLSAHDGTTYIAVEKIS